MALLRQRVKVVCIYSSSTLVREISIAINSLTTLHLIFQIFFFPANNNFFQTKKDKTQITYGICGFFRGFQLFSLIGPIAFLPIYFNHYEPVIQLK